MENEDTFVFDINTTSWINSDLKINSDLNYWTDTTNLRDWSINPDVVFENYMPNIKELEKMCEEYPGLGKAYENFKLFYKLVEDDWRNKQSKNKS
jgi:hypothetical protein